MQNSDNFLAWIRSHSVNGYENAAQIVDVPNSKYKIVLNLDFLIEDMNIMRIFASIAKQKQHILEIIH